MKSRENSMRYSLSFLSLLLLLLATAGTLSAKAENAQVAGERSAKIRVACVGDSITMGVGTPNPALQSYPAQLQELLGPSWAVTNFGVGGRTMLRKVDPFSFGRALKSNPDLVVIMLGVNDSKTNSWAIHKGEFVSDYTNAITTFQNLPSHPRVFVCLPTPAFPGNWGISQEVIAGGVVPGVRQAATYTGAVVIDTHTPLLDAKALFPDRVHPNVQGARRIAEIVAAALREGTAKSTRQSESVSNTERGEKQ